jgi:hypothetical protein
MASAIPAGGTTFTITAMPPGGGGQTVQFPAYITSIQNSFSGNWNEHNDMGHGDPKVMYSSHNQSLSVDFIVAAIQNSGEHQSLIKALNALSDMTKPVYETGLGFNGVMAKVTIGSYIQGIIGFIESVDVSVDNETPWIGDLPVVMNVGLSMRVVANGQDKRPWFRKGNNGAFLDGGY